jgi:hypothetical protein
MPITFKSGEIVPVSGIYTEKTAIGLNLTEVTCVKGEKFPPTIGRGEHFEIVRAAKHRLSEGG